jgi:hypothetical protein
MEYYLQIELQDNVLHRVGMDENRLRAIVARFDDFEMLRDLKYYRSKRRNRFVTFSSWLDIKQVPGDYIHIANAETPERSTKMLEIDVLFDKISLKVAAGGQSAEIYQQLKGDLVRLLPLAQETEFALRSWSGIRVLGVRFKQPRPPRSMVAIPMDAVFDVINTRPAKPMAELESLLDALRSDPPHNALVESSGDCRIIDWLNFPSVESHLVAERMSERLSWYYEHVPFQRLENYNELGDEMVVLFQPVKDSFYTFYMPFNAAAYKALVELPDDLRKDESIASMLRDMEEGKTRSGQRLSTVTLILPSREQAIEYLARAKALGFAGTAYPDSKGSLWSPYLDER